MSPVLTGTSARGMEWARMEILLEVPGYQGSVSKISLQVEQNKIEEVCRYHTGDKVDVGFAVYAREYNGRWYNNVNLATIKSEGTQDAPTSADNATPQAGRQRVKNIGQVAPEELEPKAGDLPW